jgi:hypothetical protein
MGRFDLQRELADVRVRLDRTVDAIARGLAQATTIREKLLGLEVRRNQLEANLAEPVDTGTAISLPPAVLSRLSCRYRYAAIVATPKGRPINPGRWSKA